MLSNIFGTRAEKTVHCEMNGLETSIEKTRVLTKISRVINLKLFQNSEIDFESKTIYSSNKSPIQYFVKLHTPPELLPMIGDLFGIVDDEDEVEQSTNILSDKGMDIFMGRQLMQLISYLDNYELIGFPETMFFVSANNMSDFDVKTKTCENWNIEYPSLGKKYMTKKILEQKKEKQTFGVRGVLLPPFDVGFSDCSAKNPNGIGYLFRTDRNFTSVNLCSNESAVDYCKKNNCLVYYTDFMNGGKMRVLSQYTPDINFNLQNDYKFRSSNL